MDFILKVKMMCVYAHILRFLTPLMVKQASLHVYLETYAKFKCNKISGKLQCFAPPSLTYPVTERRAGLG